LSLISLKYYYECIESKNECESILLVDELDATLHPAFQIKLLKLLRQYSSEYKIQVFFTTHSMTSLEDLLEKKDNVFYLVDNVTSVTLMEEPDIYKIQMHLRSLTKKDMYYDKVIPVFSEDDEARFLINLLFDYYEEKRPEFIGVRRLFHFVDINLGADNLENIFKDLKLLRSTMKAICILDGDHKSDLNNNIVALPGKTEVKSGEMFSPEQLLFNYASILYGEDDDFWVNDAVISIGYGKRVYIERISNRLAEFKKQKDEGTTTKKNREFSKELFKENKDFFYLLFKRWLNDERTSSEKYRFFKELKILFRKNAQYNGINPNEWKDE
jgi:energy-coupling factor transporter ATP-binding protein EcfA2